MIVRLDNELWFPDPRRGEEDGLFAVGGDLSVQRLILAYQHGIFPWFPFKAEDAYLFTEDGKSEILWYCPMQRFVIFPKEIHQSHSLRTVLNKHKYRVSFDAAFDDVIDNCSKLRAECQGAWLGGELLEAYKKLHQLNYAHSVEVWNEDDKLCGGLYGVMVKSVFCGESMFSLEPGTSKIALVYLSKLLQEFDTPAIIDCQFSTPHLKSMGGRYISYDVYMEFN